MNNVNKKRNITTGIIVVFSASLIVSGAFAALSDTLTHNETATIEWVEIVDSSAANLVLEDVSDATNTPVDELTPGITYELTGTLENDSTVITNWTATDLSTTPGMTVTIADADGADASTAVGEDVDVSQFGITVQVNQTVTPSTELNFVIEFNAVDARVILKKPTPIIEVFEDPALAQCVASDMESGAAGNVNYLITQDILDEINGITCSSKGIVSLEGIQYLHNLNTLYLPGNNVSDLSPISEMNSLMSLSFSYNKITDVTPLSGLTNLISLYLNDNGLTDYSGLTYQPTTFSAVQHSMTLPPTTLGTPTNIVLEGINGEDLIITWNTPGTYVNGQLTWANKGNNSLYFRSADGKINGTIYQVVN